MKRIVQIMLALTGLCCLVAGQQDLRPRGKSCEALGRPDVIVQPYQVLNSRLPEYQRLNVSDACKEKARATVAAWAAEDRANWEQLSNQLCSAESGWVEKVPGTCQAGGPPPICPVDHWVRDPRQAREKWAANKNAILNKRWERLMGEACQCYRAELEASTRRDVSPPQATRNPFVVPCGAGCPPGYDCVAGLCQPKSLIVPNEENSKKIGKGIEAIQGAGQDQITEKARDLGLEMLGKSEGLIGAASTNLLKIVNSFGFQIVTGLLEAPAFSTWSEGYKGKSAEAGFHVDKLRTLYAELKSTKAGGSGRAADVIARDIGLVKYRLKEDMQYLNEYYAGIIRERELGRYGCSSAFEYQHQVVTQSIVQLLALPNQ